MRNRVALIGVFSLAAIVFAGAGYFFGKQEAGPVRGSPPPGSDERASADRQTASLPAAAGNANRKPLFWHDPMVPGPKFDKPGKSPFMNMPLVPVYADEGGDGNVSISPRTVQNLGIRTATVATAETAMGLATVGTVAVDERSVTVVQSRVNGYVEKLHVRAQYDPVTAGQPLVDIYAPDWLSAQEEYLALTRAPLPGDDALSRAARGRLLLLGISEQQVQRLERDGKANPRVTLYAPESGVVWELGVRDGQAVSPGMTLFKLASLASVWVNAEVPEAQVALVKSGDAVSARTTAMPDRIFSGHVAAILPEVNATTRTVKARIVLANPDRLLQPGMFARVNFAGDMKRALMVPTEAVIHSGTRSVVILADEGGKFRPVNVEAGRESEGMTEIRKGLNEGQKVVVSGQFLIDSEASLKSTLDRLQGASGSPASGKPEKKP